MKYLLLAYLDERHWQNLSASERGAYQRACHLHDELLRENGFLQSDVQLQINATTATVRIQNGDLLLSDGPFHEMKEHLVGLYCISARDLNEAVRVAAHMPQAQSGAIEVRSI